MRSPRLAVLRAGMLFAAGSRRVSGRFAVGGERVPLGFREEAVWAQATKSTRGSFVEGGRQLVGG